MMNRLNPRERMIVIGGVIVIVLVAVWFLLLSPYFNTMDRLDRKIITLERNVSEASQMREQILRLRSQLATVGQQRKGARPLFSQVESLTEQTGVREQLLSMRPQPATVQGDFRQQLVEIRLESISLAQLVKLLHAVEYRSGGVQVKSMRVKPRFEDRSALDVNMVLMSLEKP
jgi:general secretion pathway protein M